MPDAHPTCAPVVAGRTTTRADAQQRPQGEFMMSGNLTPLQGSASGPVDSAAEMPDFSQREEVKTMIEKLRDRVSFWKRIDELSIDSAWENAQSYALPQHHLYIK